MDKSGAGPDAEEQRLADLQGGQVRWSRWGPYLSERQWGTVREDYSPNGDAWTYLPHDHARSRAYRWGEDGLLGICDDAGLICFALTLWNGQDPILKERMFGLSNPEGNHGEDVKECYYYLDNTPTHSWMRALYRYPQRAFPYGDLVSVSAHRGRTDPEYELLDTGIFDEDRYFDVIIEYAKAAPEDIVIRISSTNRGPDTANLHLLPTLWCRNIWSWGWNSRRPVIREEPEADGSRCLRLEHPVLGTYRLACERHPELLFTENESNTQRLWDSPNRSPYVKDGINNAVVHGAGEAVNAQHEGTKVAAHYFLTIAPGATETVVLRLVKDPGPPTLDTATAVLAQREREANEFYGRLGVQDLREDEQRVWRQAIAGLLWSKQHYRYDVRLWLDGDPSEPPPPPERESGRNHEWRTLDNDNVISMPDKWEYPWYAAWDLAFHCVTMALVDPKFAKRQLILLLREWYMRPDGQVPAYEWSFGDVNPPVHAWAALRVYETDRKRTGKGDILFLERVFHKLLLNFTWWVNRKDRDGRNVFQGGFLGLDNIGVFDRSSPLPTGGDLEQADGTAWMGMFCLNMLGIALELARSNSAYEDIATKFFEHFMYIAGALNNIGGSGVALWNEADSFFYDVIHLPDGSYAPLKVRSLVGLIPLLAVQTVDEALLQTLPNFARRMDWFLTNRSELAELVARYTEPGQRDLHLLALTHGPRMQALLRRMLAPEEFLSDYGIRSLSKAYEAHPFVLYVAGRRYTVQYEPAESTSGMFGGNSNWRGPIWFPLNYLLIEALRSYHAYYSDDFLVECPTGTGTMLNLKQIADELSGRLTRIFLRDSNGRRPVFGNDYRLQNDAHWRDNLQFYEYFDGDTARGVGASHQTGWTALVANLLTP